MTEKELEARVERLRKMIDTLQAERDKLREMLQWCAEQTWEGGDIDWCDFQDQMVQRGFFVEVEADEDFKAEWETDVMYVLAWRQPDED